MAKAEREPKGSLFLFVELAPKPSFLTLSDRTQNVSLLCNCAPVLDARGTTVKATCSAKRRSFFAVRGIAKNRFFRMQASENAPTKRDILCRSVWSAGAPLQLSKSGHQVGWVSLLPPQVNGIKPPTPFSSKAGALTVGKVRAPARLCSKRKHARLRGRFPLYKTDILYNSGNRVIPRARLRHGPALQNTRFCLIGATAFA